MDKFVTWLMIIIMSLGSLFVLPFPTFIILIDKWSTWVQNNIKDINNRLFN